jgi:hypothetical protein
MKHVRGLILSSACVLFFLAAGSASASDALDVAATIDKWVGDFNKNDMKPFLAACTPRAAVVDLFPPYAWQSCTDWINAYHANNKVIGLTEGRLWIGKVLISDVTGNTAYMIYPATFSDKENGKPVVYRGTWTITLKKVRASWVITGSASAWTQTVS